MVSNTSELLPEPDTPVNTVRRRLGSSTLTSFRLFSRAPCTRIRSWRSAACGSDGRLFFPVLVMCSPSVRRGRPSAPWNARLGRAVRVGDCPRSPAPPARRAGTGRATARPDGRSAHLLDADHVARGVPHREVTYTVRLFGRLLDHFRVTGLEFLEGAVEVPGGQDDAA